MVEQADRKEVQQVDLDRMRHSAAHVMAHAVQELFGDVKFGVGPVIEDGFYYDMELPRPLTPDDLPKIEERMREIIKADRPFVREELPRSEALEKFKGDWMKQEIIQGIPEGEPIGTYREGEFVDLCRGPHVERTGQIGPIKLLSIAGAYWRGDEKRPMLQRIYGTAWHTQEELDAYLKRLEEAQRRDHRKLGRELDLFSFSEEVGPGLILWHPKGARVRLLMEDFWRKVHLQRGYDLVYTPHVGRAKLWETSGHLSFFKENMFAEMDIEGQEYYAKPMNCPFHIEIYRSHLRSYRELPLRIGELGTVYRYERSGVLHGLMRVRGFTQDDAHIFARPDQVQSEIEGVIDLVQYLLGCFGFHEFQVSISTRPEKSVGDVEKWEFATEALKRAVEAKGLTYDIDEGGGAFYGPKIDVKIRDAIGRLWQCSTVQFDFNEPERFGMTYIGEDGKEHRPYMVHRALYGSVERFFGILVEHHAGAFPVWLAPVQAVLVPIADRHVEYARNVAKTLAAADIRVEVDDSSERMNAKIRRAQQQKVPYVLVMGDQEVSQGTVAVRLRSGENRGAMPVDEFRALVQETIARYE